MLKDSIKSGPYQLKPEITVKDTDGVTDIRLPQRVEDLAGQERLHYDSFIKAVNILLLGLPVDIYTLINHYQIAKEIWDHVKELIEGTKMTKQECESMLYDEFDKFTSEPRESIHSYYLRYAKLINDMKIISMSMLNMQINMKFVNHLQPEWSRQSQGYAGNAGKNQASGARVVNNFRNTGANQTRIIRCYNCNGEGHIAKQCIAKKRVKDSEWFKDKMLLDQAQEAGVVTSENF
ncbi:retrovirus-related pol polyprotein from transposon TNT 1-94 [Tanacetum coccineum]